MSSSQLPSISFTNCRQILNGILERHLMLRLITLIEKGHSSEALQIGIALLRRKAVAVCELVNAADDVGDFIVHIAQREVVRSLAKLKKIGAQTNIARRFFVCWKFIILPHRLVVILRRSATPTIQKVPVPLAGRFP